MKLKMIILGVVVLIVTALYMSVIINKQVSVFLPVEYWMGISGK